MARSLIANEVTHARIARIADWLVVALAMLLPWSTSAVGILAVLWLLALIPTIDWTDVRRELVTPAGGLPVLLVVLGLAGMLWADVALYERWKGFDSFIKLLAIPLLLVQFRGSDRGERVFSGYLFSCIALLMATTIVMAIPPLAAHLLNVDYVLIKNPATQSGEFVTCIFGLLFIAIDAIERRRWKLLTSISVVILGMLANMFFVATGRTALVVMLVLIAVLGIKRLSGRAMMVFIAITVIVGIAGWYSSSYLRERTETIWTDLQKYEETGTGTSSGERVNFWNRSIEFVWKAPVIGNGTGSIHSLFEKSAVGQNGPASIAAANPHNQTFAVAIQLGLLGAGVLWAMWIAHLFLFRGSGLINWIGLVVVVQNIVGSLFNSHLFDFVQGWTYVIGVGVAGGIALKARAVTIPHQQGGSILH